VSRTSLWFHPIFFNIEPCLTKPWFITHMWVELLFFRVSSIFYIIENTCDISFLCWIDTSVISVNIPKVKLSVKAYLRKEKKPYYFVVLFISQLYLGWEAWEFKLLSFFLPIVITGLYYLGMKLWVPAITRKNKGNPKPSFHFHEMPTICEHFKKQTFHFQNALTRSEKLLYALL